MAKSKSTAKSPKRENAQRPDSESTWREGPTTAREFKRALDESLSRALHAIAEASSYTNDINFLNESNLERLDGMPPLASEEHEKLRIAIAKETERMFRSNNEGTDIQDAFDNFLQNLRSDFKFAAGRFSRFDAMTASMLRVINLGITTHLQNEYAKSFLVVVLKFLTSNSSESDIAFADSIIEALYRSSPEGSEAKQLGLKGFVARAMERMGEVVDVAEQLHGQHEDSEGATDDANFFDDNSVIGE